jgi:hypothetical protein
MELNLNQQQYLLATLEHIDRLIVKTEQILSSNRSESLFQSYIFDVTPAGLTEFQHGRTEFRKSMQIILAQLGLQPPPAHVSARKGVLTNLIFLDIALEELKSTYMRGYGDLTQETARALDDQIMRMQRAIEHLKERMAKYST